MSKQLLFAVLAACGVESSAADPIEDRPLESPDDVDAPDDQHFCCESVDSSNWTGKNCTLIAKEQLVACSADILYCPGKWARTDGKIKCAD